MLPAMRRLPKGLRLIEQESSFGLHAPRQEEDDGLARAQARIDTWRDFTRRRTLWTS